MLMFKALLTFTEKSDIIDTVGSRKTTKKNIEITAVHVAMIAVIVGTKRRIDGWLRSAKSVEAVFAQKSSLLGFVTFVAIATVRIPVQAARLLVAIPIHVQLSTQAAFEQTARRAASGEFIDSYSQHIREQRQAIMTMVAMLVAAGVGLSVLGFGLYEVGRPTFVNAYSTTVDINPTWDDSTYENNLWQDFNPCQIIEVTYQSEGPSLTSMRFGKHPIDPSDCDLISEYYTTKYRPAMKFSLVGIPNTAVIAGANLIVNVSNSSPQSLTIVRPTSDNVDALAVSDGTLFNAIGGGSIYASTTWSTTGSKNVGLTGTVVSDIQARITSSDVIAIGIYTSETGSNDGSIDSVNHATLGNRPVLRVSYTLPPQAPTATSHSDISTSTIAWTWTDNATAETRYDIHDAAHASVAGCTSLGVNSQTCTETGLSTNTQYVRHPNVTDANGNTDGPTTSVYTSQNTPTEVQVSSATSTSINVTVAGTFPNPTAGSSGIYIQENVTASNSSWQTGTTWSKTGLTPNTEYSFQAKARNGDAVETSLTSTLLAYTLATPPDVTSTRSISTWYATPAFAFTNVAGFGSGGVEYYRYAWNEQSTHIFSGSETVWSGGTLSLDATQDGSWYLHVDAYDQTDNNSGGSATYGPYFYDSSAPSSPAVVNDGMAADVDTTTSTDTLAANWSAVTDNGSGLDRYEYAIGTTAGGTQVVNFTGVDQSTSVTRSGLVLTDGTAYYVSVRAVDQLGQVGGATSSDGVTVDVPPAEPPPSAATTISDVQVVVGETAATVTWTTNELATTKVRYGLTAAYGTIVSSPTLTKTHSAKLPNLKSNTTYHFQVASVGSATATTADDTFKTVSLISTVNRAIGPTLFAPVVTDGDETSMYFTGVAKGNQTLRVYLDGQVIKTFKTKGTAGQTKVISFTVATAGLPSGSHTLYVQSTDGFGRTSIIRQKIKFTTSSANLAAPTLRLNITSTYVVQPGDSLWSISQTFLGDGSRYAEIIALNVEAFPTLTHSAHVIQPGWTFQLPKGR